MASRRDLTTIFLRTEGGVLLGLAVFLYARSDAGWLLFALLILAPDVSLVGYLGGPRLGAVLYNAFHTYLGPAILAVAGVRSDSLTLKALAFIWFAHIGIDRLFGFGLKRTTGFKETHLGRIGPS